MTKIKSIFNEFLAKLKKDRCPVPPEELPVPPQELNDLVGGGTPEVYKVVGTNFVNYFKTLSSLQRDETVLEVGCGCGRIAAPLANYLTKGRYEGIDITKSLIDWANENIKRPNFSFRHLDVYNKFYNPNGKTMAKDYTFPLPSETFDFVYLTSVFTHMLPVDIEHYFSEIYRVLKPKGRCLITYFLIDDEFLELIAQEKTTLIFKKCDGYYTTDINNPEAVVGYDEKYIRELYCKHKLLIKEPTIHGLWHDRPKFTNRGQDIIIASKQIESILSINKRNNLQK